MGALAGALAEPPPPGRRLLLVVDQLEEVFAQAPADERDRFLAELARLRRASDHRLLLTMRDDYFYDLRGSSLWPLTEGERLELDPLPDEALGEAVTGPAAKMDVSVEPALVERLLRDAGSEPGMLPALQETMVQLWGKGSRRLLTLDAYRRLGTDSRNGLATALATAADGAYSELSPARRELARRMLLRLVQVGEGRHDTRRQQPWALRSAGDRRRSTPPFAPHPPPPADRSGGEEGSGQDNAGSTCQRGMTRLANLARWSRAEAAVRDQWPTTPGVGRHRAHRTPLPGGRSERGRWAERHPGSSTMSSRSSARERRHDDERPGTASRWPAEGADRRLLVGRRPLCAVVLAGLTTCWTPARPRAREQGRSPTPLPWPPATEGRPPSPTSILLSLPPSKIAPPPRPGGLQTR